MKKLSSFFLLMFSLCIIACDDTRVFEQHESIKDDNWYINQKPTFYVEINDTTSSHNIYFNLRHTGLYRYSNLFVLMTIQGPKSSAETQRYEFKLAETDGKWLGSGLGDIYSNQIMVVEKIKFAKPGVYSFSFEQNMRDNPLAGIEDVGMRIEKAKE